MSLRKASLVAPWLSKNNIFDLNSPLNRDLTFAPYAHLRESFLSYGIELNTADLNDVDSVIFEIHQDVRAKISQSPAYLLKFEADLLHRSNANLDFLDKYQKIFTWDDSLVDMQKIIKFNFPNEIPHPPYFEETNFARDHFCCLISANKNLDSQDDKVLYSERVNVIRWFEKYAPQDFSLYGVGWDIPEAHGGTLGKIERRFWRAVRRFIKIRPFPSYKGSVKSKKEVLMRTKFAICYENVRDLPGYITEKIFDCFFSGCVPVYWGAANVNDFIPSDCFIDRRQFNNTKDLYFFLKSINEKEFELYQKRIAEFLRSNAAYQFSSEYFAETVVKTIVNDLGI